MVNSCLENLILLNLRSKWQHQQLLRIGDHQILQIFAAHLLCHLAKTSLKQTPKEVIVKHLSEVWRLSLIWLDWRSISFNLLGFCDGWNWFWAVSNRIWLISQYVLLLLHSLIVNLLKLRLTYLGLRLYLLCQSFCLISEHGSIIWLYCLWKVLIWHSINIIPICACEDWVIGSFFTSSQGSLKICHTLMISIRLTLENLLSTKTINNCSLIFLHRSSDSSCRTSGTINCRNIFCFFFLLFLSLSRLLLLGGLLLLSGLLLLWNALSTRIIFFSISITDFLIAARNRNDSSKQFFEFFCLIYCQLTLSRSSKLHSIDNVSRICCKTRSIDPDVVKTAKFCCMLIAKLALEYRPDNIIICMLEVSIQECSNFFICRNNFDLNIENLSGLDFQHHAYWAVLLELFIPVAILLRKLILEHRNLNSGDTMTTIKSSISAEGKESSGCHLNSAILMEHL